MLELGHTQIGVGDEVRGSSETSGSASATSLASAALMVWQSCFIFYLCGAPPCASTFRKLVSSIPTRPNCDMSSSALVDNTRYQLSSQSSTDRFTRSPLVDNSRYRIPHKLHRAQLPSIPPVNFHTERRGSK